MRRVVGAGHVPNALAPRTAGQSGFGLIEVLIAVALAGTVVLGLAAGLLTLARANTAMEERQRLEQALGNVAEDLEGVAYLPCTVAGGPSPEDVRRLHPAPVDPARPAVISVEPLGIPVELEAVEYWDRDRREFVAACPGADQGAQLVTLRAEWRDREGHAQVVVRAS